MESFEVEGAALDLYRRAGIDPSRPVGVLRLLMALPDIDVEFCPSLHRPAKLVIGPDGRMTIRVRSTDSAVALSWRASHELGESILHRARCVSEHVEQFADNIAGAIVIPGPAMRKDGSSNFAHLARTFRTSQTIAALRFGEVFDTPLAIVMPGRVKRRGPVDALPSDAELRRIAKAGGGDGIETVLLTDAHRRAAITAI